jgi:hypothetical protein
MAAPYSEFAGNRRLLWIAREWADHADELAEWAMEHLVNRRDVWSQYTLRGDKIGVVMLPVKERRKLGTDMVTLQKLRRHFAARSRSHLIGLHSISDHSTCKWFVVDVDLHDPDMPNADEAAAANLRACLAWAGRLREKLFDPCLMDSNGAGGYHLWVLLDGEYPLADVYDTVTELVADHAEHGIERRPEVFPPKREVGPDDLPYGLRLPGRHHTLHHYTRVMNFDAAGENEWLEGAAAIEAMMAIRPAPLPAVKAKPGAKPAPPKKKTAVTRKPRVCVDLDGVLAKYDGRRGGARIGAPVDGALEFATELAKKAEIIIFTSRCSEDAEPRGSLRTFSAGQMRITVIDWLEKHKFPYTDVYIGKGKPLASAFIDDRAVHCSPQTDKNAFAAALDSVEMLLKPRPRKRAGSK